MLVEELADRVKFRRMTKAGKSPAITVVAIARELAGFVWAEMTS